MKNTKFSQKLTAITLAAVMVLSMAACDSPSGPGKSGDPGKPGPFVTVDVRAVSEWDYLLVRKDGAAILMNVDDEDITKAKPTRLYYRPNKNSDAGIAMICKENGLPEIMVVNGHIFYFTNFDGYTYDLAVIKPNDDIEYKYGVETETNFDVINGSERAVSDSRAAYNPLTWDIYDWGSMLITVGSCAAAFFVPIPFAGLCVGGAIGLGVGVAADATVDIFVLQGIISEGAGIVASSTVSVIVDGLGCLELKPFDCITAATGIAHSLFGAAIDLSDLADEKKMQKLREGIEEIEKDIKDHAVLFYNPVANGPSPTSELTLKFNKVIDGLSAEDITLTDRGGTGATKGSLSQAGSEGGYEFYKLGVSGVTKSGYVEVSVGKSGYQISPYRNQVRVSAVDKALTFKGVTADGSPGEKTTKLTLEFNEDIEDFSLACIALSGALDNGGLKTLTRTGKGVYEISLYNIGSYNITGTGEVTVKVSLSGYFFPNGVSSHTVTVYAGSGGPGEPPPPITITFTSFADFKTWLEEQPANTATTAYNVKLNIANLGGDRMTTGSLGNALYTYRNNNKYVYLDLSGSTFTSIEDEAFYGCTNLTGITIPDSVTSIGGNLSANGVFRGCYNLTSVSIPNSVISIGRSAFYGCTRLASITIPNSVKTIGHSAFSDCSSFTSITIPNSVTSIGNSAFFNCTSLTSITIPNGVPSIGYTAFYGCKSLTSITIPNSVTTIDNMAFRESGLTSITIPDNVKTIGSSAFQSCTGLTSITIPASVTSIGSSAFAGCKSLTSVTIPNGVTSIGSGAFDGCTSLTAITLDAANNAYSSEDGVLYNKSKTTLVRYPVGKTGAFTIPASVTSIGYTAFAGCKSLTSVTIPNGVTSFLQGAFAECTDLTSVTFATGSAITSADFGLNVFPGGDNLKTAYLAGGAGTYTRAAGGTAWTKQN